MPTELLSEAPANRPIFLENETCVYCKTSLDDFNSTKEHVIGRRFVPKGKLHGQWNLIVRACKSCNGRKASLEDDISAISMHPDAWGRHSDADRALRVEASRKAMRSLSRKTGKLVSESSEAWTIRAPFAPGGQLTFNWTAPPQIDSGRIFELARLQLTAFFYWITYNKDTKTGGYWLGGFFPLMEAARLDWGNPIHRAFMDAVINWEPRVFANGADGFFKVAIRRHPSEICWSWALEWNKNYRIVGFFGEREPVLRIAATLPPLELISIVEAPNRWLRYRTEKLIADADDCLFQWNDMRLA